MLGASAGCICLWVATEVTEELAKGSALGTRWGK
jgi:hypothetical protein